MLAVRMLSANSKFPSPPWASSLGLFGHQLLSSKLDSRVVWNFQECVHITDWPVAPPLTHAHAEASKAVCTAGCSAGAVLFLEVLLTGDTDFMGQKSHLKKTETRQLVKRFFRVMGKIISQQRFN